MKLCTAVQGGCGYKDTLRAHRFFAPLAKYFTVCITYQPPLVVNTENINITAFVFGHHIHTGAGKGKVVPSRAMILYGQMDKQNHTFLRSALRGDE
jgi:hypothetical protein